MPTVRLSPVYNDQVVTSAGAPASGYLIYTYAAGSSSNQTTYTSSAGTVAQANPIVLNANGAPDNPIWLTAGQSYKFVLKDSGGVTIRTVDNVAGVNDSSVSVSQWVSSGVTPTYVSASSFTLVGDQTTEFHVGRRVQCTVTAGTVYGVIAASAYTSLTTVTVALDSGSLDSGLSAVNLSILRADNSALPKRDYSVDKLTVAKALNMAASVTVASAATADIGAAESNNVTISGTTTITSFGTAAAGIQRNLTFSGVLTLTHNATSLILPTAANITTVAGDTATFVSLGSGNWRCLSYQRAAGQPLASELYVHIRDEKTSGTMGGTFTSGAWQTRTLNTESADGGSIATLASNQITLPAGTYRARWSAPAFTCDSHKTRLQNITDGTTVAVGSSEVMSSSLNVQTRSVGSARFTISGSKVFELQHRCGTTRATDGLGYAGSFGVNEVYAEIEFWKEF